MITIRFSQGFVPAPNPVVLRFDTGTSEPVPAWPIILPNLANSQLSKYCSDYFATTNRIEMVGSPVRQRVGFEYGTLLNVHTHVLPTNLAIVSEAMRLESAPIDIVDAFVCRSMNVRAILGAPTVYWADHPLAQSANLQPWAVGNAFKYAHWIPSISDYYQSTNDLRWLTSGIRWSIEQPYGPAPSRWVCTRKYNAVRGVAKIRFDNAQTAPTIRFDIPAQVCQWDEGGGYKNAHDVLPVIDFIIPIEPVWRRSYVMQPTITCERLSDGQAIAISSITLSKRRGNFAKSVSVTFQSKIDSERARNQPLKVTINGYEHRVIIEQFSKSLSFGSSSYQGQGRSIIALLASPYQLPVTFANPVSRSLVGVLSDLLDGSGWTVIAEGFTDFTIPPGAFSIQGKAPIEAITSQLDGLGLMLLSNDITKELSLVPKWPVVPWQMESQNPAIVFHEGVIQSLSESEEINPLCNGVHVRGEQVGVKAHVKRSGSAGDVTPSDISHPLIVTAVAAQLCGTAALSESGRKRVWQLTAPVMANLPIVTEGQLVGIRDELNNLHRAMVDSWTVTASVSADGSITVKQSFSALSPLEV